MVILHRGLALSIEGDQSTNPEVRLWRHLMATYEHSSRPVLNANSSVVVEFAVALNAIMDLDEKNQVLITNLWVLEQWYDVNMKWDPKAYENVRATVLSAEHLWLPDVYIFNNADEGQTGFVNANGSKAIVSYNGTVTWTVPIMIKSACTVNVLFFPFDFQVCQIKFGSWIYDGYQLDLSDKKEGYIDMSKYVTNSEFDLLNATLSRVMAKYECCPGPYPQMHLNLYIKRKALYYTYTVIAPALLLCIMTLSSFLLPCDCGEKIAIGMTVFLSIYFLQLLISDNIPESNSTPLIGIFLTMVTTLNSISLVMATIIMNIKKRSDKNPCPPVPIFVMRFCECVLGRITCTPYKKRAIGPCVDKAKSPTDGGRVSGESLPSLATANDARENPSKKRTAAGRSPTPTSWESESLVSYEVKYSALNQSLLHQTDQVERLSEYCYANSTETDIVQPVLPLRQKPNGNTASNSPVISSSPTLRRRAPSPSYTSNCPNNTSCFQTTASTMQDSYPSPNSQLFATKAEVRELRYQWFYVADVVDKGLFILYLILTVVSILTILVILPYLNQPPKEMPVVEGVHNIRSLELPEDMYVY
ncbi:neuronal acetylcholine receptor subunit alpha-5-like [Tubulanus polymorphus]|uniref:neuronal acetylcholine receptor subunit alpha-5-like n=1 Tax=Tubulanus polymorphus TaxID=672921 RepID=UPI003DA42ED7